MRSKPARTSRRRAQAAGAALHGGHLRRARAGGDEKGDPGPLVDHGAGLGILVEHSARPAPCCGRGARPPRARRARARWWPPRGRAPRPRARAPRRAGAGAQAMSPAPRRASTRSAQGQRRARSSASGGSAGSSRARSTSRGGIAPSRGSGTGTKARVGCPGGGAASPARAPSSARTKSSASAKRAAGSFSSARRTTRSRPGARPGRSAPGAARGVGQVLEGDGDGAVALEGHLPGEHLVEDHADRVEVGGRPGRVALGLLGREVLRRAHDRARLGHLRRPRPRDPEVGDLEQVLVAHDHVVRLEVAVHDAVAVRVTRRVEDLDRVVDRALRARAAPPRR